MNYPQQSEEYAEQQMRGMQNMAMGSLGLGQQAAMQQIKGPSLQSSFDRLSKRLDVLRDQIGQLEKNLDPVLLPATPTTDNEAKSPPEQGSPAMMAVEEASRRVADISRVVNSIMRRMAL